MRVPFHLFVVAVAVFVWGNSAKADDYSIGVRVRLWNAALNGDLRVDDDFTNGSSIDLDDTLDIGENNKAIEGILTFRPISNSRFDLSYWTGVFDGERRLTDALTYNGKNFTLGTLVESEFDARVATLTYQYVLSTPRVASVKIDGGPFVGLKYIVFDGNLKAVDAPTPFSSSEDVKLPIPIAGVRLTAAFGSLFTTEAEISGFTIGNIQERSGTLLDAQAEILVNVWRNFSLGGGYHRVLMDIEDESGGSDRRFKSEIMFDGFFFSAEFKY